MSIFLLNLDRKDILLYMSAVVLFKGLGKIELDWRYEDCQHSKTMSMLLVMYCV